jgi:gamma-glutamyltranspeptidase/glutathione hydrolase
MRNLFCIFTLRLPRNSLVLFACTGLLLCFNVAIAASRKPVKATQGMVVSAESLATAAGVEVLQKGGNAIDAAVAVGFALAVTYPEAGNIGGGGFMLIRLANGATTMIDFRETAPGRAARDMFLDANGVPIPSKSLLGPLASGVPGTVAGFLHALDKYGTQSRASVMQRAIDLAEHGFRVSERLALSINGVLPDSSQFPSTKKAFTHNGVPFREGDILKQPDLARTLKAVRDRGREGLYEGEIANLITAEMKRGGGIITGEDLAEYRAVERRPVTGSYRGYDIITSSPPSAGGIVLLEMLNILERFDLRGKGWNSSAALHLIAAAAQRAYADRAEFLGDPEFNNIPITELTSTYYAGTRSSSIDSTKATPSKGIRSGTPGDVNGQHTTHYSVADRFGNVVGTTVTLNDSYGCKTVVDGAGFFLNNQMDDFSVKPNAPNLYGLIGNEANAIAPHKRMLSSMTPTIVCKNDQPVLVLGSRGGGRITTSVAQVIINMIDFGMNAQEAIDAPRIHHQWLPDTLLYEPRALQTDVMENLRRMGYALKESEASLGRVQAIFIDATRRLFLGAPDPREDGVAIGY